MNNLVRSIGALATAATLAASPVVAAQDTQQQGQQGQKQQAPQGQQAPQKTQHGKITKKTNINEHVSFPLENGCSYTADVKGSIKPAGASGGVQLVEPDLRVDAVLSCPGGTKKISEKLSKTGPMSITDVEDTMERGATFLADEAGRTCVYRPDFMFETDKLTGIGVAYLCTLGAKGASLSP